MCQGIKNFKLNMILKVSRAKLELELNKVEKAHKKWRLSYANLRVFFTPYLILTEF